MGLSSPQVDDNRTVLTWSTRLATTCATSVPDPYNGANAHSVVITMEPDLNAANDQDFESDSNSCRTRGELRAYVPSGAVAKW